MTIHQAAYKILTERDKPMLATEIARIALERGMVTSTARNPVQSLANTISKNIHDSVYNSPKLHFFNGTRPRLIGLPTWTVDQPPGNAGAVSSPLVELRTRIPSRLLDKIKLAEQAKLADGFDDTVRLLLAKGLAATQSQIREGVTKQLELLNG